MAILGRKAGRWNLPRKQRALGIAIRADVVEMSFKDIGPLGRVSSEADISARAQAPYVALPGPVTRFFKSAVVLRDG